LCAGKSIAVAGKKLNMRHTAILILISNCCTYECLSF